MDQKHNDNPRLPNINHNIEKLAAGLFVSEITRTCRQRSVPLWDIPKEEITAMKASVRGEAERRLSASDTDAGQSHPRFFRRVINALTLRR
jgi:hypothetical protein